MGAVPFCYIQAAILNMPCLSLTKKERFASLEEIDILTDSNRQSVIRVSKMLERICSELKAKGRGYYYQAAGIRGHFCVS